jgi:hypothetical protein
MRRESEIQRALAGGGFTLVRHNKHEIWRCPCGHKQLTIACTGFRGRGNSNCMAMIARTLRACETRKVVA